MLKVLQTSISGNAHQLSLVHTCAYIYIFKILFVSCMNTINRMIFAQCSQNYQDNVLLLIAQEKIRLKGLNHSCLVDNRMR